MDNQKETMNQPDPTRTDGFAPDYAENYRKQMEASQMPPIKFQDSPGGLGQPLNPSPLNLSAAAPVSTTVEQRHEDLRDELFLCFADQGRQFQSRDPVAMADKLIADFEAKAVAEATAEISSLRSQLSRAITELIRYQQVKAKKL